MPPQLQPQASSLIALGVGNGVGAHHGAAVNLPELLGIELGQQILERGTQQILLLLRQHAQVFVGSLQIHDVMHPHHMNLRAHAGLNDLQRRCCAGLHALLQGQ